MARSTVRSFYRYRRLLGWAVGALLLADAAGFYVVGSRVTPVTAATAVRRFRTASAVSRAVTAKPADGGARASLSDHPAGGAAPSAPPASAAVGRASPVAPRPAGVTRAASAPTVAPATPVAAAVPGVYVYDTSGFEDVSVLGGSRHDYPAHTTMTLTNSACGQDLRWDALDQRWDRWTTCADGRAIALRALTTYHQFFGQVDERTYRCSPSTQFRPADDRRGTTFGGRCAADGAEAVLAGVVVGVETVTIGGRPVPTLHVRVDERLTGATRGSRTSESWYALGSNLLVKRTSLTDADTKATFGSTHYREHLTLQLASTTPRR